MDEADQDLWERAAHGDTGAFGELFRRHGRAIYNFCFRRIGDWSAAEDLTSVVFLEAWRRRQTLTLANESALPWLLGVATNVLRNERRARRRYRAALSRFAPDPDERDFADDLIDRMADEDDMRSVVAAVNALPRREREVLALCVFGGLDYEGAALALGLPVGTVRSRLSRARSRLRHAMDDTNNEVVTPT